MIEKISLFLLNSARVFEAVKVLLYAVGVFGLLIGFLSFFSPANSIKLYQAIMRFFNWRVEPIHLDRELRNTKWLGMLMAILSLAIAVILLSGCPGKAV